MMLKRVLKQFSIGDKRAYFLIVVGTIVWSLTMVKSGLVYSYGMGFWGPNGHDGVWHVSVAESFARGSWGMPVFSGEALKNYHIAFDLFVAFIHRLSFIPIHTLYFQVIPPIFGFLIGIYSYKFVYSWKRSRAAAFWATFFVYFGGSFGWVVTLFRQGEVGGESMFWSQQSISTLVNPPFAFSILLVFVALDLLLMGLRNKSKRLLFVSSLIFGLLVQIKVYAGILVLGGLMFSGFWRMFKGKGVSLIKVFTGSLVISVVIFFPLNKAVQEAIILKPFWFLETMMRLSDRFYWPRYAEAMVNYKLAGNLIKGIPAYIISFSIFWFGNLGTRIIKEPLFLKHMRKARKLSYIEMFFYSVIGMGVVIPTFFLQAGTPWNTIQFMYYSLMFSGILAGVSLGGYLERSTTLVVRCAIVLMVFLLTIPTTIGTLMHYLPKRPPAKISADELEALRFLSLQPEGVVLNYPFDREQAEAAVDNPPRSLNLYESTAYISAFSKKDVYMEDEVNLDITGYDWRGRRFEVEQFLASNDSHEVRGFLRENNITYIYWLKGQRAVLGESQLGIERIFENGEVDIFRVVGL